jgi:hypothetical protein
MAKHALLSASSAERWLNCTPSARLEEKIPDTKSPYAAEGTLAHRIGELQLKRCLGRITEKEYVQQMKEIESHELYYAGMVDEVEDYTNYVLETYYEAVSKCKDALIYLEEQLDYSAYIPDGFGTGDCIIIADGEMEIIDLKFGKGVEVSPIENPQLKLYALGAYDRYGFIYGIEKIIVTVAQVRLGNISSWIVTPQMLEEWVVSIKEKADLAYAGKGELTPGPWCTFCKVRHICKARAEVNLQTYSQWNKDPKLLSANEISKILGQADEIAKWVRELQDYALSEALKGTKFAGWKLVEGRSNRKIDDENALAERLINAGFKEEEIYKPKTLETITNLEKLVGKKKFTTLSEGLISKPPGKPTLVPEDDKRPELGSAEDDFF